MLPPFESQILADVGIAFGDEGKGRLVSELIHEVRQQTGRDAPVEMVLKVNGGANSGHTAGGLKLNLLPGGVIEPTVRYLGIGSGVVADPRKLLWETRTTESKGFPVRNRLLIDERTMVSDLTHRLLDLAWESYRANVLGEPARGSTGRGITPAFADEVSQWQFFYADFRADRATFSRRLQQRVRRALDTIRHVCRIHPDQWFEMFEQLTIAETRANQESISSGVFPVEEFDFHRFSTKEPFEINFNELESVYWTTGSAWVDRVVDLRESILDLLDRGQYLIGEFGQSYWLDKRHGYTPNVTASHTFTPELFQSAGIPVCPVQTFGVAKAYDTKVGTHLFLTQIEPDHPLGEALAKIEFGTSTGRQRMVGWFDAVEKGTALRYGGFNDLILNKLDALRWDNLASPPIKLKICYAYEEPSGKIYFQVPRDDSLRCKLKPLYLELEPWAEDISTIRNYRDLPPAARVYVATCVATLLYCSGPKNFQNPTLNLRYIGVGPDPEEIIASIPPLPEILEEADFPADLRPLAPLPRTLE
ncbi:MAG: adenylosuccinate synthetase [Puniceicoccaceae bacterium]